MPDNPEASGPARHENRLFGQPYQIPKNIRLKEKAVNRKPPTLFMMRLFVFVSVVLVHMKKELQKFQTNVS